MGSINIVNFRRRRKENLIKVAGGKCNICGYNKVNSALEFHHIDSKNKKYGISQTGNCHSLEEDLEEISKCILVCANCHREIHENLYSTEELLAYKVFDEKIATNLIQERNDKFNKKEYFCIKCGEKISGQGTTNLCKKCQGKETRLVERPTREELKNLIKTTPFTKIAEKYGVTDNAIRKWCDSYNLPRKKKDIDSYTDEEWEKI